MIGNIFSDVGHSAVGAHNHLGIFVGAVFILTTILITFGFSSIIAFGWGLPLSGLRPRSPLHHPAAFVLAFGLKVKHALLLQLLKRRLPEMQMENLALLRKKIVLNAQPLHGFQMAANDGVRYQLADFGSFIAAVFNVVQRLQP